MNFHRMPFSCKLRHEISVALGVPVNAVPAWIKTFLKCRGMHAARRVSNRAKSSSE